jgi:sugar (pentulose or hexulose) kinase
MEGVALAIAKDVQNFRDLDVKIERVYCVGGATRNRLLYQIKADIMQVPQILTEQPEASLRGCGLLAAFGLGLIEDLTKVAKIKGEKNIIINPNKAAGEKYKKILIDFKKMYEHLIGYWS